MKKLLPIAAVATTLLVSVAYAAQTQSPINGLAVGDAIGTSEAEIIAKLEAMGATINEVETEEGEIELEITLDGAQFEVEVDSSTGLVAEVESDEDDSEDDEDQDNG